MTPTTDGDVASTGTYVADYAVEKEVIELREDEKNGSKHIINHGADFAEYSNDNVGHEQEVDQGGCTRPYRGQNE